MDEQTSTVPDNVIEIDLGPSGTDPWRERDVVVSGGPGGELRIPAFESRGRWRFRFSAHEPGGYRYTVEGSPDVAEASGTIEVASRSSAPDGLGHGAIRVADDGRHLAHADGTPFFWLADTWWHGFVTRKIDDDEFRALAGMRAAQGFSVIQIVVIPPEAAAFDDPVRSRTGWPWAVDSSAPNQAWWDDADGRVSALVEAGLVPCLFGSWGSHLSDLGSRVMRRHWREMIARWGAYPVVWCIAGEPTVPPTDLAMEAWKRLEREAAETGEPFSVAQVWQDLAPVIDPMIALYNEITRYVRATDPFGRLITTHSWGDVMPWDLLDDEADVDIWMIQTSHGGFRHLGGAVDMIQDVLDHEPAKPVIDGEPGYEGIGGSHWEDIQRFQFWTRLMSGTAGHTYGAHGVWGMNTDEFPGQVSGLAPRWTDASRFAGAVHTGAGRRILETMGWHDMRPAPGIVSPHAATGDRIQNYAVTLPDGGRLFYLPSLVMGSGAALTFRDLGTAAWSARYIDPRTGATLPADDLDPDDDGNAIFPVGMMSNRPSWEDWLLLLRPAAE